ncbi:sugar-binding domain-containing protein [Parabacteroides merdae]|uniref:sugar-binding domain-containing protein n=1 Tax=Parabacteroides merdae TaxID=46503 RepID=UPI001C22E93B|nr:sugar-binding domain-containing protein [Parabacteroides merdae]MBU9059424.1 hypothetical protein [Parabacteroides merdae]MCG4835726.1 hypothetical protein [Parabacteroides merdae]MCQ5193491.1 hypothetical protein [Parabacteroides merdae]
MKQIKTILFAFGCSFLLSGTKAFAQIERLPDEASYPVLQELAGVETPAVLLSGTWQFQYSPDSKWDKIQVPGEPAMQGYAIEHDKPFTYRKSFTVPADYAGKHTILRFDGVYSHARLFVNGTFVREHHGGFTRWETDVTPFVRPGKKNEIRLEVTDRLDDISYASGYAHHPIGGILRDVTLFALPETCLYDFYAETHLDAAYEDAVLKIGYSSPVAGGAEVAYTLTEPSGRRYPLVQSRFPLEEGGNMNELPVKNPLKWDAEQVSLGSDYHVRLADSEASPVNGVLQVEETAGMMTIKGDGFEIPFSKETGLISNATSKGQVIIEKGPFLHLDINLNHLTGAEVRKSARKFLTSDSDWKKQSLTYTRKEGAVEVALSGFYQDVQTDILIRISPAGEMNVSYVVAGQPNGYLRETGLSFYLPERLDYLQWERKGMWSCYPEGAFAGNTGETSLYNPKQVRYGENPAQPWSADTHNYYYWADAGANCDCPLTQMAKGMKENIYRYTLSATGGGAGLTVCSPDASLACRTSKRGDGQLMLYINNRWDYPEIAWGNYCKTLEAVPCYGEMKIRF